MMNVKKKKNYRNWLVFLLFFVISIFGLINCQLDTNHRELTSVEETASDPTRATDTSRLNKLSCQGDFNGDNLPDTAYGMYLEDVGSTICAGIVSVGYGNNVIPSQNWSQDSPNIKGACEDHDQFGIVNVAGDFNNDGYDDLAIGVPWESIGSAMQAGCVNIIYGSANGLTAAGNQLWSQNTSDIKGVSETGDSFGMNLIASDINADGYADLIVGVYGEGVGSKVAAGCVQLLLGSSSGLTATGNQLWHLNSTGIPGACQNYDRFGWFMTIGEFNNDAYIDLVVGTPYADIDGVNGAGAFYYIPGCSTGFTATGSKQWTAASPGIDNVLVTNGYFGMVMVAGGFNNRPGAGCDDLAVGYGAATVNNVASAGEVYLLFGSSLTGFEENRIIKYNRYKTLNIPGTATAGDRFGKRLESGNYDSQNYEDLRIESELYSDAYLYGYNMGMSASPF